MSEQPPPGQPSHPPRDRDEATEPVMDPAGLPMDNQQVLIDEREGVTFTARSFGRQTWDRFRRHRLALLSIVGLVLMSAWFWFGPPFSPFDVTGTSMDLREGPSSLHPFGTDTIGRDLYVRTLTGGRFSILIAIVVSLLTTAIGTLMGALAGYYGGILDTLIDQLTNLVLIVPVLVVLLVLAPAFGSSPVAIAVLLALLLWPQIARVVRGLFLQYKAQEFVLAARAAGARAPRIMFRHILPNAFGPIIVNATLLIGIAIILESTLSFLGAGVKPPTPTLGNLINEAKGSIETKPSAVFIPGGFIVAITLCINFLGDGLRDALDPRKTS